MFYYGALTYRYLFFFCSGCDAVVRKQGCRTEAYWQGTQSLICQLFRPSKSMLCVHALPTLMYIGYLIFCKCFLLHLLVAVSFTDVLLKNSHLLEMCLHSLLTVICSYCLLDSCKDVYV